MTSWFIVRRGSIVAVALLSSVGCGSSAKPAALQSAKTPLPASTSLKSVPDTRAGLRRVAHAYAHALLAGTVNDFKNAVGPICASKSHGTMKQQEAGLKRLRAGIKRLTGVDAASIKIRDVAVRHYKPAFAGAEVQYDLSVAKQGNDNWIPYKYAHGRWEVADCTLLPIGGSSSSVTVTPPTSP